MKPISTKRAKHLLMILLALTVVHAIVFLLDILPTAWVETVHARHIFPLLRWVFAPCSAAIPFSVLEVLAVATVLLVLGTLGEAIVALCRRSRRVRTWKITAAVLLVIVNWYLLGFGWLYQRQPLADRLGLDLKFDDAAFARAALAEAKATRTSRVEPAPGLDLARIGQLVREAVVRDRGADAPALPSCRIKTVWPQGLLLRFGVSGVFSPFTHEPTVDPGLDIVDQPYVAAHELGHFLGNALEDEASFVAWRACTGSLEPFVRYSAHLAAVRRFWDQAPPKLKKQIQAELGGEVLADWKRSQKRFLSWRWETAAKLNRVLYDRMLKSQGVSEGVKSYAGMIRYIVAWRERKAAGGGKRP